MITALGKKSNPAKESFAKISDIFVCLFGRKTQSFAELLYIDDYARKAGL
jgi:hypothetical protein